MIKVLHIIHWPKSGISNMVQNQIKASKNGEIEYRVGFLIEDSESNDRFKAIGISISKYNYDYRNIFSAIRKIQNDINEWRPDIVHTHSFVPGSIIRFIRAVGYEYNIISTIHCPYPYFLRRTFKDIVKTTIETSTINLLDHRVIVVSGFVKDFIIKHTSINPNKLKVIYPGICIKENVKVSYENIGPKKVIIVGRLDKEKRHDRLLKIWQRVIGKVPEAQLDIIGEGSERKVLQHLINELGINDSVRLLGHRNDIPELFSTANVSVLTSDYEGFPLVIMEAFLQKRTVVAFDIGSLREIIDSDCGILVEPSNLDGFAQSLVYLLQNPDISKKLGENGFRKVISKFDVNIMVRQIEKEYRDIITK
jgi:L-malate glycosyltransferase